MEKETAFLWERSEQGVSARCGARRGAQEEGYAQGEGAVGGRVVLLGCRGGGSAEPADGWAF